MGPEEFARAATRRTKAVIVAHIGGIPADIAPICQLAAARGIYRGQPEGVPTWSGYHKTVRFDIAFIPEWMRAV
jgi:hypothetical protein